MFLVFSLSKNSYKNNEAKDDIARRALAEAKERKEKIAKSNLPKELDGRDGPEPTRYNDWEKNGITSDF